MSGKSHKKIFIITGIAAVLMFGFCFAMVPLYSLLCKATGINTTLNNNTFQAPDMTNSSVDLSREITLQFVATNNMGMPWEFAPKMNSIKVHPGEKYTIYYKAKNPTDHFMTVQAIPSMTPPIALSHFHKIECFCFRNQSLDAHQSKDMALIFTIDKDLPKEINEITLSYTLFDITAKTAAKTLKG